MIYKPGQVKNVVPFIPGGTRWFLLGGPADGDEAQVLHAMLPAIKIIGFEPNPAMCGTQHRRRFPGRLLQVALWNAPGEVTMRAVEQGEQGDRSSSLVKYAESGGARTFTVVADTLDRLSTRYGPFKHAVLWADIEDAELQCLQGAVQLLTDPDGIQVINVEAMVEREAAVRDFLNDHGFEEVHRWNQNQVDVRKWCDIIYRRRSVETG